MKREKEREQRSFLIVRFLSSSRSRLPIRHTYPEETYIQRRHETNVIKGTKDLSLIFPVLVVFIPKYKEFLSGSQMYRKIIGIVVFLVFNGISALFSREERL